MNWYILYTACRAEKQVEQRLRAEGVEVFLPLHLAPRRWSDRVKLVEVPLFSSYLFVRTTDEVLRTLTRVSGVARIVFYNRAPATISPNEIRGIKDFCEKARGLECNFDVNDEVMIASGPLKDMSGKIIRLQNGELILSIPQIGITVGIKPDRVVKKRLSLS